MIGTVVLPTPNLDPTFVTPTPESSTPGVEPPRRGAVRGNCAVQKPFLGVRHASLSQQVVLTWAGGGGGSADAWSGSMWDSRGECPCERPMRGRM